MKWYQNEQNKTRNGEIQKWRFLEEDIFIKQDAKATIESTTDPIALGDAALLEGIRYWIELSFFIPLLQRKDADVKVHKHSVYNKDPTRPNVWSKTASKQHRNSSARVAQIARFILRLEEQTKVLLNAFKELPEILSKSKLLA